jgi:hypothetical protein
MSRVIPGNGRVVAALVFEPDAHSVRLAGSMAVANNTASPMAGGLHSGRRHNYGGDRGYGVNRQAGRTPPQQFFAGAAAALAPVQDPRSRRLGAGAGVAGQPGLPSTGQEAQPSALAWMSMGQLTQLGMGA